MILTSSGVINPSSSKSYMLNVKRILLSRSPMKIVMKLRRKLCSVTNWPYLRSSMSFFEIWFFMREMGDIEPSWFVFSDL